MIARKPVTVLGKHYRVGQRVPWNRFDGPLRRRLYERRMVVVAPSKPKAAPSAPSKTATTRARKGGKG